MVAPSLHECKQVACRQAAHHVTVTIQSLREGGQCAERSQVTKLRGALPGGRR